MPIKTHVNYVAHVKAVVLQDFTGKERWKVWYNKFNNIAQLKISIKGGGKFNKIRHK